MPSQKRQRALARAKWERQQARRQATSARRRKVNLVAGIVTGLVLTAALVWVVVYLVQAESGRNPQPTLPSYTGERPSFLPEPTTPTPTAAPTSTQPGNSPKARTTPSTQRTPERTQGTR